MEIKISPSMMCADLTRLGEQVHELSEAGADLLHWDIIDGHFAHNFGLNPDIIAACRPLTRIPFDVHLMANDPAAYIDEVAAAGADMITLQLEPTVHIHRAIAHIHRLGKMAGVALNPMTPLSFLETILPELDMITLMTVDAGFAGQTFVSGVLPKLHTLRQKVGELGLNVDIQVDGQIKAATIQQVVWAGANVLVVGTSGLFAVPGTLQHTIQAIRATAREAITNHEHTEIRH